jgi:hypothetical protein
MSNLILPTALELERHQAREEVIQSSRAAATRAVEEEAIRAGAWDPKGPLPDPEAQRFLDQLAPRDGFNSWLKWVWNPGYPWAPVNRWQVMQMSERHATPDFLLADLEGPDPRTVGYYDKSENCWRGGVRFISRIQWDLYRETGCYGATLWIVQGDKGGHRAKWNHVESALSRMAGGPTEPPAPGSLPFAPFDRRVREKLSALEDATRMAQCIAATEQRPDMFERQEIEAAQAMRGRLWEWLGDQVMPEADKLAFELKKEWSTADLPTSRNSLSREIEDARTEFIHDDDDA